MGGDSFATDMVVGIDATKARGLICIGGLISLAMQESRSRSYDCDRPQPHATWDERPSGHHSSRLMRTTP